MSSEFSTRLGKGANEGAWTHVVSAGDTVLVRLDERIG
jgi:hypothetical protein